MAYIKTVWENSPSENTPISAENLNNIENGISGVDTRLTTAENDIDGLDTRLTTVEEEIDTAQTDINNAEAVIGNETDTYSASSTYALGDLVIYNNLLYKCTTAITVAEAWNSAKWTQVNLTSLAQSGDAYSTSEIKTNKVWIDGKPIYRKCFSVTTPATLNDWTKLTDINISNFGEFTNLYGKLNFNTTIIFPIPYTVSATDCILLRINNGVLEYYTPSTNYTNKAVIIIFEYTKTTD